jgi:RHS repeat-associated protein
MRRRSPAAVMILMMETRGDVVMNATRWVVVAALSLGSVAAHAQEVAPAAEAPASERAAVQPSAEASSQGTRFGFTGHEYDAETGLYYMKGRYYDPQTGRFLTEDPFAGTPFEPASLHRYLYAYGNPTVYVDPSGKCVGDLQKTELCQAIARALEFVIAGDPVARVEVDIERRDKILEGRREFREQVGREPEPGEVVWFDGRRGFTSDGREVDASGRIEPDHVEWMAVPAGTAARSAAAGARAAGAGVGRQVGAAAAQLGDEALGELAGVSPRDVADLALLGRRAADPDQPQIVVESADFRVELRPLDLGVVPPEPGVLEGQIASAYPRGRRVAGTKEGRRANDPPVGFRESGAFDWTPDNVSRMERGQPPIGSDGRPVELHHRDQSPAGPLDEVTSTTHQALEHPRRPTQIDRDRFAGERRRYWVERVREAHGQGPAQGNPQ